MRMEQWADLAIRTARAAMPPRVTVRGDIVRIVARAQRAAADKLYRKLWVPTMYQYKTLVFADPSVRYLNAATRARIVRRCIYVEWNSTNM